MTRRRQRGFALLLVLSMAAFLALIGTRITATGRTEALIARNLRAGAAAEAAVEGAVAEAMFRLRAPAPQAWAADGQVHRFTVGTVTVEVRLDSETGRINPNTAPVALLVALLRQIGLEPDAATRLAAHIFDWHTPGSQSVAGGPKEAAYRAVGRSDGPPGRPFESVGELADVLGMTPAILAALRPLLSVYNEVGVDERYAHPAVRAALAATSMGFDPPTTDKVAVAITAWAVTGEGARAARRAIVWPSQVGNGPAYRILAWEVPDAS